nr:MAG TPA: hypothetical protein [Bacteriophage sp.]
MLVICISLKPPTCELVCMQVGKQRVAGNKHIFKNV